MDHILKKRWLYVVNGFIVLLFMGCSLAWSIFVVPLENTYGWVRTETSMAFTLNVIFFSVGGIFSGILNKKLSFPAILRIAAVMVGAGFFLSSFADQVWILYITYSFLCGAGIGLGYNAVVSTVPLWFPEKIGAINGILLTGYALSSAVLGVAIHAMIENMGIVNAFRVLAVICMAGLFLGSFNLKMPNMDQIQKLPRPKRHDGEKVYNLFTLQMIKTPIFWTYFFLSSMLAGIGLVVLNHVSPLLIEEFQVSSVIAAGVVSALAVCNGAGRVIWGIVIDRLGIKRTLGILTSVVLTATVLMVVSLNFKVVYGVILGACMAVFVFGGNACLMPTIVRELFGYPAFALNFSVLCINCFMQSTFPTIAGGLQVACGNYLLPIGLLVVLAFISIVLAFVMRYLYNKNYMS